MIVVITNKGAGPGGDSNRTESIREAFTALHVDVDVVEVDGIELTQAALNAVAAGAQVVVAAGGDGTVSAVAAAVVGSATAMGVLPMGTLNHFAKDAGIPLDLAEAGALIVSGTPRAIDVASVNGRVFINNSSIGLYPLMVRDRDKQRSKLKRSKWWAMILASAAIFKRFPTLTVRITIDEKTLHCQSPAVFVGNNIYELDMLTLGKRYVLDGGVLSVFVVRTRSRWRTLSLLLNMMLWRLEANDLFEVTHTKELWMETKETQIDVSLDGEVVRMRSPLHYKIMGHSLNVILPPSQ